MTTCDPIERNWCAISLRERGYHVSQKWTGLHGSPDLNPIEHLWDQLGRAMRKRVTNATTLAGLRQILIDEWNAIPQQRFTKLIKNMRMRCQTVVQALGLSTRY